MGPVEREWRDIEDGGGRGRQVMLIDECRTRFDVVGEKLVIQMQETWETWEMSSDRIGNQKSDVDNA